MARSLQNIITTTGVKPIPLLKNHRMCLAVEFAGHAEMASFVNTLFTNIRLVSVHERLSDEERTNLIIQAFDGQREEFGNVWFCYYWPHIDFKE